MLLACPHDGQLDVGSVTLRGLLNYPNQLITQIKSRFVASHTVPCGCCLTVMISKLREFIKLNY